MRPSTIVSMNSSEYSDQDNDHGSRSLTTSHTQQQQQQQQQHSSSVTLCLSSASATTAQGGMMRRMPCKARAVPKDHNITTAYFDIPANAPHGMVLVCSHFSCATVGTRFRYCAVCDIPVAKRNFPKRHAHGMWPPVERGGSSQEDNDDENDDEDDDNGITTSSKRSDSDQYNLDDMSHNDSPPKKRCASGNSEPRSPQGQVHTFAPRPFRPKAAASNLELCRPISSQVANNNALFPGVLQQVQSMTRDDGSSSFPPPAPHFSLPFSPLPMDHHLQQRGPPRPHTNSLSSSSSSSFHTRIRRDSGNANRSSITIPTTSVSLDARELAWLRLLHSRPQQQPPSAASAVDHEHQPRARRDSSNSRITGAVEGMNQWVESVLQVSSLIGSSGNNNSSHGNKNAADFLPPISPTRRNKSSETNNNSTTSNTDNDANFSHLARNIHATGSATNSSSTWDMEEVLQAAEIMVSESSRYTNTTTSSSNNNDSEQRSSSLNHSKGSSHPYRYS